VTLGPLQPPLLQAESPSLDCEDRAAAVRQPDEDIAKKKIPTIFVTVCTAWALVMMTFNSTADQALETARSEMNSSLGIVPPFIASLPEATQTGAWEFWKGSSGNPKGQIPAKYWELIALAVAAQIPCTYCSYAHTAFARANGATDVEIREAISYGAEVRLWSTVLNGNQYDLDKFKLEIDGILKHAAESQKGK